LAERVNLSKDERDALSGILNEGLRYRHQWAALRIALARSLQIPESPDPHRFKRIAQDPKGSTIHREQLTGESTGEDTDYTDVYRALLSVYSGRDLFEDDDAFHEALQAHLRRGLCVLDEEWDRSTAFADYLLREVFYDRSGARVREPEGDDELVERVTRILGQVGVGATVIESAVGPRITRLELELATLEDLDRLRKGVGKIAFALGWGENAVTSTLAPGERRVFLSVPRPAVTWRTVDWSEVRIALPAAAGTMALPTCVGTNILGQPFVFDLAETPHMFIGGTTGSGKSMCLHAILLSLLVSPTPPELVLIDPKAVEFNTYAGNRNVRDKKVITSADEAFDMLNRLVDEMNARQEVMGALDARNITEANERNADLRRIVVVIDELGDLFLSRREIETPLIRLAQKARSAGIHLVLATQRPEAATFPGLLRSNVPSRIALTVQKSAESRIILDEIGAETLLMRGDMLVRLAGRATERAHGCRITSEDIQEVLAR
jgi:S-DNA-T family DNA segregation ATPase FtsK/SpoIIIE